MKKILIIDDSMFMRNVIKDILESNNEAKPQLIKFDEADGKTNALKQIQKEKPDIILLDIVMQDSEREGIELLEAIKPYFDISKVIIISSIGQNDIVEKCNELGVSTYIQKPIEEQQLLQAVNQIIK